jgi:hypothetical protein
MLIGGESIHIHQTQVRASNSLRCGHPIINTLFSQLIIIQRQIYRLEIEFLREIHRVGKSMAYNFLLVTLICSHLLRQHFLLLKRLIKLNYILLQII